ncbi:pyruvate ferredoxin/flavodoxin oxidoreductase family protein [Clostridium argentinense CDC 2741]|uniref:Pyruvate ferredoxin/flavodoxin oxidoreductase family protein n=1 Tax=Clostridium argentinense CDC 2741 TaxID=1418104 RepID=A0A0C1R2E6_9CLOT|nr:2-oxoacid:acceptor oxidoreductase family protein [Clostridium argentinense]ARC83751.1 2-oxoacid:ferredoxin oxidoreductase subunit gamma [Clostridium argentinense]KIE44631.1 pyruvate ferredoxin/flavodoxin oxidoreductase family protein [Clostridium argentinense CDC 2741]NFF39654.1 2-oxoacid:ferredoxin oxidoreductase subunit gamma [Clostridium argentinense]NFP49654.1 2-oxoacid:ferredoxin oxidoreductase subunit gamma [Clostridium argentinense]NFP72055.1 2-oxoacid:ferredoxin oxidoreductase subun
MASQEVIFAGFGGQGILSMGKFLAYAGMDANKNVSWLPSYGPEMRGGTANCSVIVTDDQVGSPIVTKPTSVVVMNRPSLDKFEKTLVKGGLLIIDSNLVDREIERTDIEVIRIPAQDEAAKVGSGQIANMVLLGALVAKTQIVSMDELLEALKAHGKEKFFEINRKALEIGASYTK